MVLMETARFYPNQAGNWIFFPGGFSVASFLDWIQKREGMVLPPNSKLVPNPRLKIRLG